MLVSEVMICNPCMVSIVILLSVMFCEMDEGGFCNFLVVNVDDKFIGMVLVCDIFFCMVDFFLKELFNLLSNLLLEVKNMFGG